MGGALDSVLKVAAPSHEVLPALHVGTTHFLVKANTEHFKFVEVFEHSFSKRRTVLAKVKGKV